MISKSTLVKKLVSYSTLATLAVIAKEANAQVIHHRLIPRDTLPNNYEGNDHYLDLNNDGNPDFIIFGFLNADCPYSYSNRTTSCRRTFAALAGNDSNKNCEVLGFKAPNNHHTNSDSFVSVLFSNEIIGSGANKFYPKAILRQDMYNAYGQYQQMRAFNSIGNWFNIHDKFVGLRIQDTLSKDYYYGWVRLTVFDTLTQFHLDDPGFVVVEDYAFQTQPNTPIVAGDTGTFTNTAQIENEGIKLYAAHRVLNVRLQDIFYLNGSLTIFNEINQLLVKQTISSENFTVSLAEFSPGVYYVQVEKNGKRTVKKILIE